MKKFNILSLCIMLCLITVPKTPISALELTNDLPISKTATWIEDDIARIEFSLPIEKNVKTIDLVFLMDTTTVSNFANVRKLIGTFLDELLESEGVEVRIGVIAFNANVVNRTNGLLDLNTDTINQIKAAFSPSYGAGTNLHGGLSLAQSMLDASDTSSENKYLVVASDLAGWLVDSGDGLGRIAYGLRPNNTLLDILTPGNQDFYGRYKRDKMEWVTEDDVDQLITSMRYFNGAYPSEDLLRHMQQSGPSVGEYEFKRKNQNAYPFTQEEKDTMPSVETLKSALFPTYFEKSIYLTGNIFKELKDSGYNIMALTVPYQPTDPLYKNFNNVNMRYQEWFETHIGSRFEAQKNEGMDQLLNQMGDQILYALAQGTITDQINPDFQTIVGTENLEINGESLDRTNIDENHIGFGSVNDQGIYDYEFKRIINNEGIETIQWTINKIVRYEQIHTFTIDAKLVANETQAGAYIYDTNLEATIEYINSSEAKQGITSYTKSQDMPSPSLSRNYGTLIIKYKDENDNEIKPQTSQVGKEKREYTVSQPEIDGYSMSNINGSNVNGLFINGTQTITFVYKKNSPTITPEVPEEIIETNPKPEAPEEIIGTSPKPDVSAPINEDTKPNDIQKETLPKTGISETHTPFWIILIGALLIKVRKSEA